MLTQSLRDLAATDAPEVAAALAFYALVSLFPLLLSSAVVASFVVEPTWAVTRITDLLGEFVPSGAVEVEAIVTGALAQRGRVGLISFVVLLASGRRVLGALTRALNRVSDVDERRDPFLRRIAVEAALLVGIGAVFGLAISARPLLGPLEEAGGSGSLGARIAATAVLEALRAGLLLGIFFLVYVVVPRGARDGRAALLGAAAATGLFLVARPLFLFWIGTFWDSLNLIYGPLAVGAALLFWSWYVALIALFGGSLASHAKVMAIEGRGAAEAARRHGG